MKIKLLIPFIALLILLSCGSTDEGKNCADQFFSFVINEKYDSAVNMVEHLSLENEEHINSLKATGNHKELGKLISVKKNFGFSTNISNGITTVKLPYLLKFEKGEITTEITILERGNGYKITSIN